MPVKKGRGTLLALLLCLPLIAIWSLTAAGRARRVAAEQADVARGKYLVADVAMCTECHTPRDDQGKLDPQAWLQGAPIWIMPTKHIPDWADYAPVLAGLPSYTDEQVENVLEHGVGLNGGTIRPPMHIYHMNPEDAKAIIAYLKSLPIKKR
jgi:mono/diheme cytochrome c family protein